MDVCESIEDVFSLVGVYWFPFESHTDMLEALILPVFGTVTEPRKKTSGVRVHVCVILWHDFEIYFRITDF